MSWWGKVIFGAIGLTIGGPLGGLVGLGIGHGFDNDGKQEEKEKLENHTRHDSAKRRERQSRANQEKVDAQERTQAAFFLATFSIMGHVAKVDGRVTIEEIRVADAAFDSFDLAPEQRITARRLFTEGKHSDFPIWEILDQFRRECRDDRSLFRAFMTIQIELALSDGHLHYAQLRLLEEMARVLGFSTAAFESMLELGRKASSHGSNRGKSQSRGRREERRQERPRSQSSMDPLDSAYKILDVTPEQTDADVKTAYRRMMNQYHPDKLIARGLPKEMVLAATEKAKEIQNAWAMIKKERSIS